MEKGEMIESKIVKVRYNWRYLPDYGEEFEEYELGELTRNGKKQYNIINIYLTEYNTVMICFDNGTSQEIFNINMIFYEDIKGE